MFYIPFIGKKLQENDEKSVVSFDFQNVNSLYLGHHHVNSFCSSSVFLTILIYKEAFNTTRAKNKTIKWIIEQGSEFRSLRKFACTAGARGFTQTVANSSNM